MQLTQINKYEHEDDGGSKKKTKLILITTIRSSKYGDILYSLQERNKNKNKLVATRKALHLKS
jgi:hypothetical protein